MGTRSEMNNIHTVITEAVSRSQMFLKISPISQENNCGTVSF